MKRVRKHLTWYSFLLPSLLAFFVLSYLPSFKSLYYSFFKVSVLGFGETFVGLKNYRTLLSSSGFLRAVANTFALAGLDMFTIAIGFGLASLLNRLGRGKLQSFFRVSFYIPNVMTGISVILLFQMVLKQEGGLLNSFLSMLLRHDVKIGWLADSQFAKLGVSIMSWWKGAGYAMLISLAGLQSIPSEHYEASEVDGCNSLQQWWYITLPQMVNTFAFLVFTNLISSFSRFTDLYVLSMNSASGRPGGSLQTIMMYIYQYSFETPNYGLSSAGAVILFVIIFAVTMLSQKLSASLQRDH
ncbi:ABC transporter permease subunit [Beduinella massiliensis]|uniref:ABC transporter permease subunit n=1 Tax=Beduinella massiliensis TaxID=1852363 RepID=UPI000C8537EE